MVKVLITRKADEQQSAELSVLLKQLRGLVLNQPGYVSAETLRRADDPNETLVIATWHSVEDYMKWVFSKERAEVQDKIDKLTGIPTEYKVYRFD